MNGPMLAGFMAVLIAVELLSRAVVVPLTVRGGIDQLHSIADAIRTSGKRPAIVFLGTSHVQCGIVPAVIERRLGLERGAVLNAGMGAGMPYEQLQLYTQVESALQEARLAVVEITPMYFNRTGAVEARLGIDLATRLRYPAAPLMRADWLLGWVFSVWDARRTWRSLGVSGCRWALRRAGLAEPAFDADGYPGHAELPTKLDRLRGDAERAAAQRFQPYSFDEDAVRHFTALLKRIEAHGTRIILLEYPVVPEFRTLLETRYAEVMQREEAVLAGPLENYRVLRIGPTREAELSYEFRTPHHLTKEGAVRFSAMVAESPELRALAAAPEGATGAQYALPERSP